MAKVSTLRGVTKEIYVCHVYLFGNTEYLTCHGHLEQHKTSRIISICVTSPMADKASSAPSVVKETHATNVYLFCNRLYITCPCLLGQYSTNTYLCHVTQCGECKYSMVCHQRDMCLLHVSLVIKNTLLALPP